MYTVQNQSRALGSVLVPFFLPPEPDFLLFVVVAVVFGVVKARLLLFDDISICVEAWCVGVILTWICDVDVGTAAAVVVVVVIIPNGESVCDCWRGADNVGGCGYDGCVLVAFGKL